MERGSNSVMKVVRTLRQNMAIETFPVAKMAVRNLRMGMGRVDLGLLALLCVVMESSVVISSPTLWESHLGEHLLSNIDRKRRP